MSRQFPFRIAALLGLLTLGIMAQASASMNTELLRADFNDKPLNMQIGTGGAAVGEPIDISSSMTAQVKATPLSTPSLHLSTTGGASRARFQFIDSEEILSGELRISFVIHTPPILDRFTVLVRETNSSSHSAGAIEFSSSGTIRTRDAAPDVVLRNYSPNEDLRFELIYQLAAGTYDVFINGVQELDDHFHGETDLVKGIGALLFGFPSPGGTQEWVVDDILVVRGPALLNADFDDKPLNTQIGTGGASVGEPISIAPSVAAKVQGGIFSTPALAVESLSSAGSASAIFQFVNDQEIVDGELRISFRVLTAPIADQMYVRINERDGVSFDFGGLNLAQSGNIRVDDDAGSPIVATFTPGDELFFEFRYAMDLGTYDVYLNRVLVLDDRAHGVSAVGRGIGSIALHKSNTTASQWVFDDLNVYQPGVLFQDGFD